MVGRHCDLARKGTFPACLSMKAYFACIYLKKYLLVYQLFKINFF